MNLYWFEWICTGLIEFVLVSMDLYWIEWICTGLNGFELVWMDLHWFEWIWTGLSGFVLVWMDLFWFEWICTGLNGFVLVWNGLYWLEWICTGLKWFKLVEWAPFCCPAALLLLSVCWDPPLILLPSPPHPSPSIKKFQFCETLLNSQWLIILLGSFLLLCYQPWPYIQNNNNN